MLPAASCASSLHNHGYSGGVTSRPYATAISAKPLHVCCCDQQHQHLLCCCSLAVLQEVLELHNSFRARHQVGALSWSSQLQASAQIWANRWVNNIHMWQVAGVHCASIQSVSTCRIMTGGLWSPVSLPQCLQDSARRNKTHSA
jgi:hypothetical protein